MSFPTNDNKNKFAFNVHTTRVRYILSTLIDENL